MQGLEEVYVRHHTKDNNRKRNHVVLADERSRFLKKYLGNNKKLLDIGCRDGELITHYNNHHDILGLDIDSEALRLAKDKTGIQTRQCDLNGDWGVEHDSFEAVVACEVVEHLYHPDIVFGRIKKALKSGGVLVGSVPHAFNIQTRLKFLFGTKHLTPLADPTHINHFTVQELRSLLEKQFTDVEIMGITTPRYHWLSLLFPFLFAHTLLFKGIKK